MARSCVPVFGVANVAFFSVQVCMNPIGRGVIERLDNTMGSVPVPAIGKVKCFEVTSVHGRKDRE